MSVSGHDRIRARVLSLLDPVPDFTKFNDSVLDMPVFVKLGDPVLDSLSVLVKLGDTVILCG